ncbi:LysR family transcriptional regulator [Pseudomonas sp. DTU_2021_1001937_2_SI_NGA_ILE_001]|uniref:LysR family transcriptional regulator n=1 Tax=Pseudomonas sp. DTU_2021_1001937_2_SI_NGA_ILE_001 TaxID=3077589 RepID=UPI0028FC1685|nr:LysR family transcriptional regulator [Pseudomonas sp. DTU_2021_1001937_2_SI_NGA_ILE_001]WNW09805.1 LysR family transcriptional regulator [Pseudomonas sp. DTU_2021_1001937_2_SI_NGA_ILE_001]
MRNLSQTDLALLNMPSFKALRSFVAAARYRSFSRAAEALCVTQAAISRQIRDLEEHLGTELFLRQGREVSLTAAGSLLLDTAQLSMLNIYQTTERIRRETRDRRNLTLCCTHALSALRLGQQLKGFANANPEIRLNVITTERFRAMEPGIVPDIFISQALDERPGYRRRALFHEVIYPVCTPAYLDAHPQLRTAEGLRQAALLDLDPYGRAQLTERFDWNAWFSHPASQSGSRTPGCTPAFSSNDYSLLMQLVLDDQGVALGWDHLVAPLLRQGRLVRPLAGEVMLKDEIHYLVVNQDTADDPACLRLQNWLIEQFT